MLACTALVGCNNEDVVNNEQENKLNGDAYVTVKLSMNGDTGSRAFNDGIFKEAEDDEVAVKKAIFYFLDANGQGCADKVVLTDEQVKNLEIWDDGADDENVDTKSEAIVVIKNPVATPASLIVLLNCNDPFTGITRPSMDQIQNKIMDTGDLTITSGEESKNYHIMSNAVYVKGSTTVMVGAPITEDNIAESTTDTNVGEKDPDTCDPVIVSVERLWAKVGMTPTSGKSENLTATGDNKDYDAAEGKAYDIQVNVTGWWLASKADKTYLVKNLSSTYENVNPFVNGSSWWNDASRQRSYWANMPAGVTYTNNTTYNKANATDETEYCLENTSAVIDKTNQNGTGTATQYVAQAVLKLKVEDQYIATTFVRYLNKVYSEADFFDLLATNYSNYVIQATTKTGEGEAVTSETKNYFLNGTSFVDGEDDLNKTAFTWIYNNPEESEESRKDYEGEIRVGAPQSNENTTYALAKVSTNASGEKQFKVCTPEDITALQTSIDSRIGKVLLWLNGKTYYYTDIIHNSTSGEVSAPLYGIVRNHLYTLNIADIQGMGTPVPEGNMPIDPERPEGDKYSHISAEVQILSYKVVPTQNATLK